MTRLPERTAALAAAFSAVAFVMDLLLARRTHLLACSALLPFLFLCAAISLLVFVRLRLRRLAAEEARDEALARSEAASSAMFASEGGSEAFTVARSRDQFEKYFVSAVAPLLAVGLALWTFRLWRGLPWGLTQPADPLLACAFLAGQAFFFFLLCRYDVGLSRSVDWRILRGPAMAAGLASLGSMAAAASAAAAASTVSAADPLMARALILVTGALAVECLLSFIVALYSPRRGAALAVAYESRLATWFADPAGWARNMAQALDYQFGFQVTETGFFRLIRRALAPLLAAQIALLYLMSSLVFIGPDEEAVLEHFGKPPSDGAGLSSGFHLKWPWPFETLRRFPARRMLTTHVGYQSEPGDAKPPVLLWTIPHYRTEDSFLVPSAGAGAGDSGAVPVNLVSVNMPVEYRITNIHHFAYNVSDPEAALRHVAYRALTREVGALDLFALLGEQRPAVGDRLRDRIQRDAEALGLGVRIEFVGLQGVHPPVGVAPAFESVVGALESREAAILAARARAAGVMPVAAANADKAVREADAYRLRRRELAGAEAHQFEQRLAAYRRSPEVFKSRFYLASMRDALVSARKYIVDAPASREVIYLNMEEKPFPELFDLDTAPEEGKSK